MSLHQDIAELCLSTLPQEACGVLLDDTPVLCRNTSDKPEVSFVIAPEDYLRYRPTTIFHSHPTGEEGFSDHDLAVAANMELTSYVYIVEAYRLERWSAEEGLAVFENVLKKR